MTRRAGSNEWAEGEYIRGHISGVDSEGRGIVGKPWSNIRIATETKVDRRITARITSTDGEYVIAERVPRGKYASEEGPRPPTDEDTVWIQQTEDTTSAMGWYPKYSLRAFPMVYHCNLFERAEGSGRISPEEPPWLWQGIHSIVSFVVGIGVLLVVLGLIVTVVRGSVVGQWGGAVGQSPVFLLVFLTGLALTYAGWFVFEYLLWLVGAILGSVLGFVVGGFLSVRFGLAGGEGLLLTLLSMGGGASALGSLFLLLHRVAIMLSAFLAVGPPLAVLLSGGAVLSATLDITSVWLAVPALVGLVAGGVAAVLTWVFYKGALVLVTSFLGATILVYLPVLAQSGTVGFSFQFLLVFVSGLIIQSLFAFAGE